MFEIHVTVNTKDVNGFVSFCEKNNVKPIVIDLQSKGGMSVQHDVMTSSKLKTNDINEAKSYLTNLSKILYSGGWEVCRGKIESSPFLDIVPSTTNDFIIGDEQYFESHLRIKVLESEIPNLRDNLKDLPIHISRNVFKKIDNEYCQLMATIRVFDGKYEEFKELVDTVESQIKYEDEN
jgi:hypothetical protein